MATCNLVLTAKKVIDVKINKIKQYLIRSTKISFKSPKDKFKTFKAEESKSLAIIKNVKTRKTFSKSFFITYNATLYAVKLCQNYHHKNIPETILSLPKISGSLVILNKAFL